MADNGKVSSVRLSVAEKANRDFSLSTKGETDQSSVPQSNNAVYKLAKAFSHIDLQSGDERLLPLTRGYFEELVKTATGEKAAALKDLLAANGRLPESALAVLQIGPQLYALLRTT